MSATRQKMNKKTKNYNWMRKFSFFIFCHTHKQKNISKVQSEKSLSTLQLHVYDSAHFKHFSTCLIFAYTTSMHD